MISKNISTIPSFMPHAKVLIPILQRCLSGDDNRKIVLSQSYSTNNLFVVPIEEADAKCITLETFLTLCDCRMNAEFAYQEEVIKLRNNICNEFDKLIDINPSKEFINFVKNQKQEIINALIDATKIEDKAIAEKFYHDLMNNTKTGILNLIQFYKVINGILWRPLLTPLPVGALNLLKELVEKLDKKNLSVEIGKITAKLVEYIRFHVVMKKIKDTDFKTSNDLTAAFEELIKERRICTVEVRDIAKSEKIVKKFRDKCIQTVVLVLSVKEFLKIEPKIDYDMLKFTGNVPEASFERCFNKIQKTITGLEFKTKMKGNCKQIAAGLLRLKLLTTLNMNLEGNKIEKEGAITLSAALQELIHISILDLNFKDSNIGKDGAKAVSAALQKLKNISTLSLNFGDNNIEKNGAIAMSVGLKELKNISTLNLNLERNKIEKDGAIAMSAGLKELKNISTLNLNLVNTNIGEEGAIALSTALQELKNISTLNLNLEGNYIGQQGTIPVSTSLKLMKKITILYLNLAANNIEAEAVRSLFNAFGMLKYMITLSLDISYNNLRKERAVALSDGLKELKSISTLYLNLKGNHIKEEGAIAISAGLKELKNISTLDLNIGATKIRKPGVIAFSSALKELKNISNLNLDLWSNWIGPEGTIALSAALKELTNLTTLNLKLLHNNVEPEGAKALFNALGELKKISTLNLYVQMVYAGEEGEAILRKLEKIQPCCKIFEKEYQVGKFFAVC